MFSSQTSHSAALRSSRSSRSSASSQVPRALQCSFGGAMSKSRRDFLITSSIALLGAASAHAQNPPARPPGAPPTLGTAPAVGPEVSAATFAEAEKLVRVEMTDKDRAQAASNWRNSMAALYERRTGPHKVDLPDSIAPWSQVNPVPPGHTVGTARDRFIASNRDPGP